MSKRKYKPYPTRKQQKSRRMRNIALTLIALIVAIVIFNRTYNDSSAVEQTDEQTVALGDILPSDDSAPARQSGPLEVLNPAVASAREEVTPVPQPAAVSEQETVTPTIQNTLVSDASPVPSALPTEQETLADVQPQSDESSTQAKALVEEALQLRDDGKIIQSRELLNDTLKEKLSPALRSAVKFQLNKLAEQWLFSSDVFASDKLTSYYVVQSGDNLEGIAKMKKVPYEILMKINGIERPELLRADQKLKVIEGPFNVVVYKNNFTMDLYLQDKYIKTYRVGLGRIEHETPNGRWRVNANGKLIKPTWTDPDTGKTYVGDSPDYPLGSRWIALDGIEGDAKGRTGFAIHGTKDPETIGSRSSRGCIRLFNGDAIEVYNLLYGGISEVLVMD